MNPTLEQLAVAVLRTLDTQQAYYLDNRPPAAKRELLHQCKVMQKELRTVCGDILAPKGERVN